MTKPPKGSIPAEGSKPINPADQTPKPPIPKGYTAALCGCGRKKPNTKGPRGRYGRLK